MEIVCFAINAAVLVYGGVCDYRKREIPDLVPLALLATGLASWENIFPRLACMAAVALVLLLSAKAAKTEMPGGDFKLLCSLTFSSGVLMMLACLLMAGVGALLVGIVRKMPCKRSIPLCTYVAPAYLLAGIIFF